MTDYRHDPLWCALADMRIEPHGAALDFTTRLARENAWSIAHAQVVMLGYRRFLYLAAIADAAVTPSEDVDQAWHLHLAYSRHYWDELCGRIIGWPLHHGPTEGGARESARYAAQYEATLARYAEVFGETPPAAVWPSTVERFAARPVRIDRARYWLLPKRIGARAGLATGGLLLAACSAFAASEAGAKAEDVWFVPLMIVFAVVLLGFASFASRKQGNNRRRRGDSGGCGSSSNASDTDSSSESGCGGGGCGD